jgi:hypothetical protein
MSARQDQGRQQAIEEIARASYDACHPQDSFDDLKRRAAFPRKTACSCATGSPPQPDWRVGSAIPAKVRSGFASGMRENKR